MLEIKKAVFPSPEQWDIIISGMRNPKNSWDRSDSYLIKAVDNWDPEPIFQIGTKKYDMYEMCQDKKVHEIVQKAYPNYFAVYQPLFYLGDKDKALAKNLISLGEEHMKFMRQLPVIFNIRAPLYWWKQADTYQHTVKNACSTMHKLTEKEFGKDDFSTDHIDSFDLYDLAWGDTVPGLEATLVELNHYRDKYLETKNETYWNIINELLPQSYNQLRTWSGNYAVLFKICAQRADHKLGEWNTFIEWVLENVPYFRELCFDKLCKVSSQFNKVFNEDKKATKKYQKRNALNDD